MRPSDWRPSFARRREGPREVYHWIGTGASFGCNPLRAHFGLGAPRRSSSSTSTGPRSENSSESKGVPIDGRPRTEQGKPGLEGVPARRCMPRLSCQVAAQWITSPHRLRGLSAMPTFHRYLLSLFISLAGSSFVGAQCGTQWSPDYRVPGTGVDAPVRASANWDPDGVGPLAARLVVAGDSSMVLQWEWGGSAWSIVGGFLDGAVHALATTTGGDLFAAGAFGVAKRTGAGWALLGAGAGGGIADVRALTVMPNGELIAAGDFVTAGGLPANRVARWTGAAWAPLAAGLNATVFALAVLANGDLVAGTANGVVRWNGMAWSAVGGGATSLWSVQALAVMSNGDLVAGGHFGGSIARWDGNTWATLGVGLTYSSAPASPSVYALQVLANGDLVAGGDFDMAGGISSPRLARWNGSSWSALAGGAVDDDVHAMSLSANGTLVVGGEFSHAGSLESPFLVMWNGAAWWRPSIGVNGMVLAAVRLPTGDIVIGGEFTSVGGLAASNVARWDGWTWSPLGSGTNQSVAALAVLPNGGLVAAGAFTAAGGVTCNYVSRWDGSTWNPLGSGLDQPARALLASRNGDVVVGGSFSSAGGAAASRIARWNGTAWFPLGGGVNLDVYALTQLPDGDVVAGGTFTAAGGLPANRVARWNGATWGAYGSGLGSTVRALATSANGQLLAGGEFPGGVARWSGSWLSLGSGANGPVYSLTVLANGDVVAGGDFTAFGGVTRNRIARWTGSTWQSVANSAQAGPNARVSTLLALPDDSIVAGGAFTTADTTPASGIAHEAGSGWNALVPRLPGNVDAMAVLSNGALAVSHKDSDQLSQLGLWNGVTWQHMYVERQIYALAPTSDGRVVVAMFDDLGFGNPRANVVLVGPTSSQLLSFDILNDRVYTVAVAPNGDIIAGGAFTSIDGTPAQNIARWNGSVWSAIGPGLDAFGVAEIRAAVVLPNGDVAAGGQFDYSGGVGNLLNSVARWDGVAWRPLGGGISGIVYALAMLPNGDLIAGGLLRSR